MPLRIPTNRTFKARRDTLDVLTNLPALLLPASPEIQALSGIPAGKAFVVHFTALIPGLREGDQLVNEAVLTETYRIQGLEHYDTPRASHTEAIVASRWGNA